MAIGSAIRLSILSLGMSRLFELLFARPVASLLVVVGMVAAVSVGALQLEVDFSPEQVYSGQDDAVAFSEEHKKLFRFEDTLILIVLESTDERDLVRSDCFKWLTRLADSAEDIEGVRSVTSVVTLSRPTFRSIIAGEAKWETWLPAELFENEDYTRQKLDGLPLLNDTLISSNRRLMLTLVDIDPQERQIQKARDHLRRINELLETDPPPTGTTTFLSGVPAIRVDVIDSIVEDQMRMVPVCSLLFLAVSFFMFRSVKVTFLSMISCLVSVGLTSGLMGWFGVTFSVMSNMIPPLLLIIAAANSVHLLSRFQVEIAQCDAPDYVECARRTMNEMSRTCALTLCTTGVGFGSLILARADLLQKLAIQAATGMACCYLGLMLVIPQTLVLCAPALAATSKRLRETNSQTRLAAFGQVIVRHNRLICVVHILLAIVTLWMCRNIAINSYMFETYDGDHPTMQAVTKLDDQMSGLVSLEVQLRGPVDRMLSPECAAAMAEIRREISADERVTFYRDYIEILSVLDHGRVLSDDPEVVRRSLRFVERTLRKVDVSNLASPFLNQDQNAARVMLRLRDVGSAGMNDLIGKVTQIMEKHLPEDIEFRVTGDAYLHAVCMDAFVRDLFNSLLAASAVIFLLITLLFRSLKVGLISAIPNLFPLVTTLGYMQVRGYELTAANVIVFAISLGIAVDDTIHFLARYRDEIARKAVPDAINGTLRSSGRAIVLTSVLIVSGLSVLVFSEFVPTRRFAELTAVTMCSALPGDILLLPALLSLFGKRRSEPEGQKSDSEDRVST